MYIKVPDMNDSMSLITIGGIEYTIRFTYNEKYDYWSFGLYDGSYHPIIAMTRVVPNFPLCHYYTYTDMPDGVFGCISDTEAVGRYAFQNKTAEFVYIPRAELKE